MSFSKIKAQTCVFQINETTKYTWLTLRIQFLFDKFFRLDFGVWYDLVN